MRVINGIEIYDITDSVIQKYRNEAKRFRNIDIEVLKRRLTSMIINAHSIKKISECDTKYKFGGCYLHVNEPLKLITEIGWYNKEHSSWGINKNIIDNYIKTNLQLGLNKTGNKIIE